MAFDLIFTNNGIEQPSASAIREEWEQVFISIWGSGINLDASTKQGQLITSLTTLVMEKNAQIAKVFQSFNPKTAKNDDESGIYWQDAIGNIYGMEREGATKTSVLCNLTGRVGTVIPNTAQAISDDGDIFQISQSITIPSGGEVSVYFLAVNAGAVSVPANTLKTIYTPVVGWDTINNTSSGVIGKDVESREDFENRREKSLAKYSFGQVASLEAVLSEVDGVTRFIVKENDDDNSATIQNVSLSPHSVYCVVEGGTTTDVGEAIRSKKNGGCSTNGSVTYTDMYGTLKYDRPTYVPIEVSVVASNTDSTPDDIEDLIKDKLVENMSVSGSDLIGIGETLYVGRFYKALSDLDVNLESITVGTVGGVLGGSVDFDLNEVATLDSSNITVTIQ